MDLKRTQVSHSEEILKRYFNKLGNKLGNFSFYNKTLDDMVTNIYFKTGEN